MDKELSVFRTGEENTAFSKYFIGKSYLEMLSKEQVLIANVTFEPGCRNNWHIHMADEGGGQILLVTAGRGWYQEWGMDHSQYSRQKIRRNHKESKYSFSNSFGVL